MPDVHTELGEAWTAWQNAALYKTWAKANPGENQRLLAYRAGGPRPNLATPTGYALVCETAAWLATVPAVFGAKIPQPFPDIPMPAVTVQTWDQLAAALKLSHNIRVKGKIRIPGNLHDPDNTISAEIRAPNTTLWGDPAAGDSLEGRILVLADNTRIRGLEVFGSIDGIKIADGRNATNVDIDQCWIHDVDDQGVLSAFNPSAHIWVRRTRIERVGLTVPPNIDASGHCIYMGGPTSDWVVQHNDLYPRAFGAQCYPQVKRALITQNTITGGAKRGGILISGATDIRNVGNLIINAKTGAFEIWDHTACTADDNLVSGSPIWTPGLGQLPGQHNTNGTPTQAKDYVRPEMWDYVTSADAGAPQ